MQRLLIASCLAAAGAAASADLCASLSAAETGRIRISGVAATHDGCAVDGACPTPVARICRPEVTLEPIEKRCYRVERKAICIPAITFPWSKPRCVSGACCDADCPQPACGRVKWVHVMVPEVYECGQKCVCEWNLKDVPCGACDACRACDMLPAPGAPTGRGGVLPAVPRSTRHSGRVSPSSFRWPPQR